MKVTINNDNSEMMNHINSSIDTFDDIPSMDKMHDLGKVILNRAGYSREQLPVTMVRNHKNGGKPYVDFEIGSNLNGIHNVEPNSVKVVVKSDPDDVIDAVDKVIDQWLII